MTRKLLVVLLFLIMLAPLGCSKEKSPSEPGTQIEVSVMVVGFGGGGLADMTVGIQIPGDHVDGLKTDASGWTKVVTMRTRYDEDLDQCWVKVAPNASWQGFEGEVPLQEMWSPRENRFVLAAVVTLYM